MLSRPLHLIILPSLIGSQLPKQNPVFPQLCPTAGAANSDADSAGQFLHFTSSTQSSTPGLPEIPLYAQKHEKSANGSRLILGPLPHFKPWKLSSVSPGQTYLRPGPNLPRPFLSLSSFVVSPTLGCFVNRSASLPQTSFFQTPVLGTLHSVCAFACSAACDRQGFRIQLEERGTGRHHSLVDWKPR